MFQLEITLTNITNPFRKAKEDNGVANSAYFWHVRVYECDMLW